MHLATFWKHWLTPTTDASIDFLHAFGNCLEALVDPPPPTILLFLHTFRNILEALVDPHQRRFYWFLHTFGNILEALIDPTTDDCIVFRMHLE